MDKRENTKRKVDPQLNLQVKLNDFDLYNTLFTFTLQEQKKHSDQDQLASSEREMNYGDLKLPKGFGFRPSDKELLSYYLDKKNQGVDPQIKEILPVIDVTKHEPRDLPDLVLKNGKLLTMPNSEDMIGWYFFCPRVYKHNNNSKGKSTSTKINRTTKEGSWKKQGNDHRIKGSGSDEQHIGGKRFLTFYLPENKKTDWVIHEYYLTKAGSNEQIGDFVLCWLNDNHFRNKSGKSDHDRQDGTLCDEEQGSNELGNVAVIRSGKDDEAEDGGGSCSMAINIESSASKQQENIIPFPYGNDEERQAFKERQDFKELEDAVFGFDHSDGNDPLVCEDQPDSSDSLNSEMIEELLHKPGALAFPDTSPMTPLQSSIYTKLDTNNSLNDENRKRKYSFADSDLLVTKKNHTDGVSSTPSSDSENQAANMISEGYAHPGGNLASDLSFSQELQSVNREPRDLPLDNNSIDRDQFPSITDDFEFSLSDFSDVFTDGSFNNENNESAYALVNGCSQLPIGATHQCS